MLSMKLGISNKIISEVGLDNCYYDLSNGQPYIEIGQAYDNAGFSDRLIYMDMSLNAWYQLAKDIIEHYDNLMFDADYSSSYWMTEFYPALQACKRAHNKIINALLKIELPEKTIERLKSELR